MPFKSAAKPTLAEHDDGFSRNHQKALFQLRRKEKIGAFSLGGLNAR
jgi:hypothetical protein